MRRLRGLTLIETIVVCTLLGLLTTGLVVIFASYGRQMAETERRRDYITEAQKGIGRLELEMGNTSASYVSLGKNQVIFPSAQTSLAQPVVMDDSGKLVWQRWIAYAVDTKNRELWRGELSIARPSTSPGAPPAIASFSKNRQLLSDPAQSLSVVAGTASGLYQLTLKVGDDNNAVQLSSQVGVRN
ncbi:hypothetical protein DYH09_04705 [bacterium CPR1]|nr:hypothetical protein [bacterium CPR1]